MTDIMEKTDLQNEVEIKLEEEHVIYNHKRKYVSRFNCINVIVKQTEFD